MPSFADICIRVVVEDVHEAVRDLHQGTKDVIVLENVVVPAAESEMNGATIAKGATKGRIIYYLFCTEFPMPLFHMQSAISSQ